MENYKGYKIEILREMDNQLYSILKNHRTDLNCVSFYDAAIHVFSPQGVPMQTLSSVSYEMGDYARGFLARGSYVEIWSRGKMVFCGGPATPLMSEVRRRRRDCLTP